MNKKQKPKGTKMKKLLLSLAGILLVANLYATTFTTLTFSGIVTEVNIDEGDYPGYFDGIFHVKVGDPFHGSFSLAPDYWHYSLRLYVGGDAFYSDTGGDYYHNFSHFFNSHTFEVDPQSTTWGGTDRAVFAGPGGFSAYAVDLMLPGNIPHVSASGISLKHSVFVPETGDTGELFGLGLLALAGMWCARRRE